MHPTEALTTMSFANFLHQTDAVGLFVFGLLVAMSIVSWYFIVLKAARVIRIRTRSHHVVTTFWKAPTDQAFGYLEQQPDWEPFSKIALDGEFAMEHHDRLTEERVAELTERFGVRPKLTWYDTHVTVDNVKDETRVDGKAIEMAM